MLNQDEEFIHKDFCHIGSAEKDFTSQMHLFMFSVHMDEKQQN